MKRLKVNIVGFCIGAAAMASAAEKPNVVPSPIATQLPARSKP